MNTYKVKITETLEKVVEVEARNKREAEQIVCVAWENEEHVLGADNFARVNFTAELPAKKRESYER